MFKVERKPYGAQFAFEGTVTAEEMQKWSNEAGRLLSQLPPGFGVLVDNRNLRPGGIAPEAQAILEKMQLQYKKNGMARSCVVLNSATVTMQLQRAAQGSGIQGSERFLNASIRPNWEQAAMAWLKDGVEPD